MYRQLIQIQASNRKFLLLAFSIQCFAHPPLFAYQTSVWYSRGVVQYMNTKHQTMKTTPETKILNAINRFYTKRLRMPAYSEIAELIGVASKESAYRQVQKLIELKMLRKDKQGKLLAPKDFLHFKKSFGTVSTQNPGYRVRTREDGKEMSQASTMQGAYLEAGIPMLGLVEAGLPSEAEQQTLDVISLNEWLVRSPETSFVLQVKGDSMVEAGIHNGDHVIVDTKKQARLGDVVIARFDGGVTMKYLRQKGSLLYLEPANKYFSDMYPESELSVQAVVTAVIRKLG